LPNETVEAAREVYIGKADALLADQQTTPYGYSLPIHQNYWLAWGAACMTNHNRPLLIAHALTGDRKYRDAAIRNADFMFGGNPLGMSWTTGIGHVYPVEIQHAVSERDGIPDPVPGITLYGITGGPVFHRFREKFWQGADTEGKETAFISEANKWPPLFRSFTQHPHVNTAQCEFTVHETMAGTIFSAAMLMNPGWMPDNELKSRRPRGRERLFGYWMLP
jgi:hypothetical protein